MRIAVLGYGSLINDHGSLKVKPTTAPIPGGVNIKPGSRFRPAKDLDLPIRLGRVSSAGTDNRRITMVVHPQASDEPVYFAEHQFTDLNHAIEDLRKREGIGVGHPEYIGYVDVVNFKERSKSLVLAERIMSWAVDNGFEAVIWTELPANIDFAPNSKGREIIPMLQNDPVLLQNTKAYVKNLPTPPNTLQRDILHM